MMLAWLPENVSAYGGDIDAIFELIHYAVGAWFVAAQVFLVYCLIRFRRRSNSERPEYMLSLYGTVHETAALKKSLSI